MRIKLGDLRRLIGEAAGSRGIKLIRVGGLSPVKQARGTVPERYGIWAFIWPYAEPFLLGSTGPEGITHDDDKSRWGQLQRDGWTKFVQSGPLYTRLDVPGSHEVKGWYYTDGPTLDTYMKKVFAQVHKHERQQGVSPQQNLSNPHRGYSKDVFEVFVPEPDERGF